MQGKGPDGKWTMKPLTYRESNIFHLCITSPPGICVNLVLNTFTLLAVTKYVVNEYFLISNLHCTATNVT